MKSFYWLKKIIHHKFNSCCLMENKIQKMFKLIYSLRIEKNGFGELIS